MGTDNIDLEGLARSLQETQRSKYIASVSSVPLDAPQPPPSAEEQYGFVQIQTHEVSDGSRVFSVDFNAETPSKFKINTDSPDFPHILQGIKTDAARDWKVTDFTINPDLKPKNELLNVCKKSELPEGLKVFLPDAQDNDGVNLKVDSITQGGSTYDIFLARVFDATIASSDARLKSAYFFISRSA